MKGLAELANLTVLSFENEMKIEKINIDMRRFIRLRSQMNNVDQSSNRGIVPYESFLKFPFF